MKLDHANPFLFYYNSWIYPFYFILFFNSIDFLWRLFTSFTFPIYAENYWFVFTNKKFAIIDKFIYLK